MSNFQDQEYGRKLLRAVAEAISKDNSSIVLKGGTALMLCYGLERFSEDIDLDSTIKPGNFSGIVDRAIKSAMKRVNPQGYSITVKKNTDTTCRVICHFDNGDRLKVELKASVEIDPEDTVEVDGIKTYRIGKIAEFKLDCIVGGEDSEPRTAARDLHDLAFISRGFDDELSDDDMLRAKNLMENQSGVLDRYLPAYEEDPLVETDLLEDMASINKMVKGMKQVDIEKEFPSPGM